VTPVFAVSGEGYVAAAGVVFLAILVIYLAIMAAKIQRIEREVTTLSDLAEQRDR
jgi:hypothetical protein